MTDFSIAEGSGPPIGEVMTQAIGKPLREVVENVVAAETYQVSGVGDVYDDLNAMDFTSQAGTTYLPLLKPVVYNFVHNVVLYSWTGPKEVNIGTGGDYTAVPVTPDLVGQGTADHSQLLNRHIADAHTTADIDGLDADQAAQDLVSTNINNDLQAHKTATYAHQMGNIEGLVPEQARQDQDLVDHRTETDAHPTSSITGLDQKQLDQDNAHTAHLNDTTAECHDQYATEAASLATFALAGYGGIIQNAPVAIPDISGSWELFDGWDAASLTTPRYITQDFASNGIRFDRTGVFSISIKISIAHDSGNAGRVVYLRFYDGTVGAPGASTFVFGVGRNVEYTNLTIPGALFEVPSNMVGNLIQLQIGGGDTFSSVQSVGASFEAFSVSEAQGLEA
ncbi:hypothetical protein N9937_01395 [bacterium]|nr:hypothetical protein [bacterium]